MSDRESVPRGKQGVHGWRAFLLMFGCGTLAALFLVGSVIGIGRGIISSFDDEKKSVQNSEKPKVQDTFSPGELNICKSLRDEYLKSGSVSKEGDAEGPIDTAERSPDASQRMIRDKCKWSFNPPQVDADWILSVNYEAMVRSDSSSKNEWARNEYKKKTKNMKSLFSRINDSGDVEYVDYSSKFMVGSSSENDNLKYMLVGISKSGVTEIIVEEESRPNGKPDYSMFRGDVRESLSKIAPRVLGRFKFRIPD